MTIPAPKIDERTAPELVRDIHPLLPRWYQENHREKPGDLDTALMQVFARFGELIINRLNRAPEKNFLAFLDLLGVSPLPMEAARVPLTFSLTPGSASAAVPEGTQVAAPPPKGEQRPVVFETERELYMSSARLDSLLSKNGQSDQYTDLCLALIEPSDSSATQQPAEAVEPKLIPHLLYIALPISPVASKLDRLRLKFTIEKKSAASAVPLLLRWEAQARDEEPQVAATSEAPQTSPRAEVAMTMVMTPSVDGTKNLTETGDIVFLKPQIMPVVLEGLSRLWVCCRLLTPLSGIPGSSEGMVQESALPLIKEISAEIEQTRKDLALEQGFWNTSKLDVTKDFFPFGERPKFGDTFYFAQREAFSNPDAKITIHVELAKPSSGAIGVVPPESTNNPQLTWEFWNGRDWEELGTSGRHLRIGVEGTPAAYTGFEDQTESLLKSEKVSFRFGSPPAELNLNGVKNYWLRVRIAGGDYGREAQVQQDQGTRGVSVIPPSFAPPVIRSISLDYEVKKESAPPAILTYNDFEFRRVDAQKAAFKPFLALTADEAPPALYFGFAQPAAPATAPPSPVAAFKFPNRPLSVYVVLANVAAEKSEAAGPSRVAATWEYWNGLSWKKFPVPDETEGFRRSGLVQLLVPEDFRMRSEFGRQRYWLRMRLDATGSVPRISSIHLNTTTAVQGAIVPNDLLGSSNGKPEQKFRTTQAMVLPGQKLEVREPTMPPAEERSHITRDEGGDAIQRVIDPGTGKNQFWVTWHEVPNFYGSKTRDRHYVLDHVSGEVSFGDGANGMVPPVLDGNIRMSHYRSGGGTRGNLPPQAIKQLVSAIPYVQKVTNLIASSGGTDPETNASLLERGPRGVRHGGRAVAVEDYEDLAILASREVARAKCVPLYDLKADPDARRRRPGLMSLILVPNSADFKPTPSSDLFDRVISFLDARRLPMNELVLVGPEYVRVDVSAEILVERPEVVAEVELGVRRELDRYLHPVTGGAKGDGWGYGRLPQRFDLCVLIEKIPGVSHVRDLRVGVVPDRPGAERTGRFLICGGQHEIRLRLEEQYAT